MVMHLPVLLLCVISEGFASAHHEGCLPPPHHSLFGSKLICLSIRLAYCLVTSNSLMTAVERTPYV